jgi:maltooligosyltrehalose trehalohydrolase
MTRSLPVGVEIIDDGTVHARVWAPRCRRVEVAIQGGDVVSLQSEAGGYFSASIPGLANGGRYQFRLDRNDRLFPDPASRFQPEGPHGPSQLVDPRQFQWSDNDWPGISRSGLVIYEMHTGTFTPEGTWKAACDQLEHLANLGITALEIMPVAEFPGKFGWGYDGVNLFAPTRLYGEPDDFRDFVNQAHRHGLAVILDVVYNHFGPDGNYLGQFSTDYFSSRYKNEWGEAINFDGENSAPVREFFLANAAYWIREFHLDGLRLDATQQIFDASKDHVLSAMARAARSAAPNRSIYIVAENETQEARLVRTEEQGGFGLDALWNDDFHHSAHVALTGKSEAYYSDYAGTAQEFVAALNHGFLFQGQYYSWQKKCRGHPALDLAPDRFVTFLDNHDQVANSLRGERCHVMASPAKYRAMTALLLLGPNTPMLFQGQEFAASSPFLYFADHERSLAEKVADGRREFLAQFPELAAPEARASLADPGDAKTFEMCRLDFAERERHHEMLTLHRDLLAIRRNDPVFESPQREGHEAAVIGPQTFVLRYFSRVGDRLLLVNLGSDLECRSVPNPLVAPPESSEWRLRWSSADQGYGGPGSTPVETESGWRLPAETAIWFEAAVRSGA